jgi:hypothetical protein
MAPQYNNLSYNVLSASNQVPAIISKLVLKAGLNKAKSYKTLFISLGNEVQLEYFYR